MRLFVALQLSADVRETFTALLGELRRTDPKPRWVQPENLHITLKFIGHIADEKLPLICAALSAVPVPPPMTIEFHDLGFFPNALRPTVVWAGMLPLPELAALANRIDNALAVCGVPPETRPFAPHLTLARLKETRLSEALRAQIENAQNCWFGKQIVRDFCLIESKLKSTGAEYTTLRSFPFAAKGINQ
jgi:RNA 2',3'-cyclic 3'-phosphodiesterase